MDADFVVPFRMASALASGRSAEKLKDMREAWKERHERIAMVVPAFERSSDVLPYPDVVKHCEKGSPVEVGTVECWMYHGYEFPLTKERLVRMVRVDETATFFYAERVRGVYIVCNPSFTFYAFLFVSLAMVWYTKQVSCH
jgi:hypothetical protein